MHLTTGHSDALTTQGAISEAIAACSGADAPVAALLWMSPEYEAAAAVQAVVVRWPGLPIAGCTSDGVLSSVGGFHHEGIVLTLISGAGLRAQVEVAEGLSRDGSHAVVSACRRMGADPAICFAFPAPSSHDVHLSVHAAEGILQAPVVGCCSADHREFLHCQEIAGDRVLTDSMPILAIYGDLEVSVDLASGWTPVGREYRVTRAEGQRLLEVDGRPAVEMINDYYGSEIDEPIVEFPFAVQLEPGSVPFYRAVFEVDTASGALTLGSGVPEGAVLRMSDVELDQMLCASREALDRSRSRLEGATSAFIFNCAGRKWVLGSSAEEEAESLLSGLSGIPAIGTYGFGEIGRLASEQVHTAYHNESCVTVFVGPRRPEQAI